MTTQAQFMFAAETTYGTRATPNRALPFLSESVQMDVEQLVSAGLRVGRRTQSVRRLGRRFAQGPVELELAPQGATLLLEHAIGAKSTSGSGPDYSHTYTVGSVSAKSLSAQFLKEDEGGTIRPHDFVGLQIPSWSLQSRAGEFVKFTPTFYGAATDLSQTAVVATHPTGWLPFAHVSGAVEVAGSEYVVDDFTITGNNGLTTGRHAHRATTPERPRQARSTGFVQLGGTLNGDYFSNTAYARFLDGTEVAIELALSDGASASLTFTGKARFTGTTPTVRGAQINKQALPFVFTSTTSDADAFTAVLVNQDATA